VKTGIIKKCKSVKRPSFKIPNTTGLPDGFFSHLKDVLRVH